DGQPGIRTRSTYGGDTRAIIFVACELDLDRARVSIVRSLCGHHAGRRIADRVGREQRARLRHAEQLPDRLPHTLCLKIPERAVESVARAACGKESGCIGMTDALRYRR